MRPQEARRYEDEAFYFDNRVLVIDTAALPERYPQVEAIDGQSVVCTYRDDSGQERTKSYGYNSWNEWFYPGTQFLRVEAGTGEVEKTLVGDEYQWAITGEQTGEYDLQEDDLIIAKYNREGRESVVILPANEPLPADDEGRSCTYMPIGVITGEQKLVAWGGQANATRWLADVALAYRVTASNVDAVILQQQFASRRPDASLIGLAASNDALKAYFKWLQNTGGEDFMPTSEPEDRRREFEGQLTEEQRARYF